MPRSAFPPPSGSAGAAHFRGETSLESARRKEALRARAEGRAPRPIPGTPASPAPDPFPEPKARAPGDPRGTKAPNAQPSAGLGGSRKGWERGRAPGQAPPSNAPAPILPAPPPPGTSPRWARSAKGAWPLPPACLPAALLDRPPEKARVCVAGLVVVRQRPGSAKGVIFVTLEDETGVVNIVVWQKVYERFRREVIAGRLLRVTGPIQRDGQVVHVVAERIEDLSPLLDDLARGGRAMPDPMGPTDEVKRPVDESRPGGRGKGRRGGPPAQTQTPPQTQPAAPPAAPPVATGGASTHPRSQAKRIFASRDFH